MPKRQGEKARPKGPAKDQAGRGSTQPRQAPLPADNPYVLDWACTRGSGQNFVDAACLLSLLCKQLREDTEDMSDHERDVDAEDEQDDAGDDDLAPWDSQIGDNQDQERLQLAHSRLRNRFLDRLAEVLARVRGAPGEVASAYMVEGENDEGKSRVEIRVEE